MTAANPRVALFPCTVPGNRRRSEYAAGSLRSSPKSADRDFLLVHAGPRDEVVTDGSLPRIQLRRGRAKFPLDGHHEFDLLFLRHYPRGSRGSCSDFIPVSIHITGPSDVGILGACLAHNLGIPLAASWQTKYSSICPLPCVQASFVLACECFRQAGCSRGVRQLSCRRLVFTKSRACCSPRIANWLNCSGRRPASPVS